MNTQIAKKINYKDKLKNSFNNILFYFFFGKIVKMHFKFKNCLIKKF